MTEKGRRRCHEMSCSVALASPFALPPRAVFALPVRRRPEKTDYSIYHVFLHTGVPARSRIAGPDRANRRPPKTQFCSYNVPVRMSSICLRRLRPGSGLGLPLRKGKDRAAAPPFAFSGFRRGILQGRGYRTAQSPLPNPVCSRLAEISSQAGGSVGSPGPLTRTRPPSGPFPGGGRSRAACVQESSAFTSLRGRIVPQVAQLQRILVAVEQFAQRVAVPEGQPPAPGHHRCAGAGSGRRSN